MKYNSLFNSLMLFIELMGGSVFIEDIAVVRLYFGCPEKTFLNDYLKKIDLCFGSCCL